MRTVRIIPRLDVKGPNLVKGIHLEGLRVLGRPEAFAKYYYQHGADELLYVDVVASLLGRNNLTDIIKRAAREIFIPLTVGGGIRTIEDIRSALRAGADKVLINTAALADPSFIQKASRQFGSSTIVVAIEAIQASNGEYLAFTNNGREHTGMEVVKWATQVADLGAGEVCITSVDREGTGKGFDLTLVKQIVEAVGVPVIASGGAGHVRHVREVVTQTNLGAVAIASLLHYNYVKSHDVISELGELPEGNIEFLRGRQGFKKINDASLEEVRDSLADASGVTVASHTLEGGGR